MPEYLGTAEDAIASAVKLAKQRNRRIYIFKHDWGYGLSEHWGGDHVGYAYPGGRTVWKRPDLLKGKDIP